MRTKWRLKQLIILIIPIIYVIILALLFRVISVVFAKTGEIRVEIAQNAPELAVIQKPSLLSTNYVENPQEANKAAKTAILSRIANCESGDRQFDANGRIILGKVNPADVGRYQINSSIHANAAFERGWNIWTDEGNTAYALYLYQTQGTSPWSASEKCWSQELTKK